MDENEKTLEEIDTLLDDLVVTSAGDEDVVEEEVIEEETSDEPAEEEETDEPEDTPDEVEEEVDEDKYEKEEQEESDTTSAEKRTEEHEEEDEEPGGEEEDELTALKAQNAELLLRVNELAGPRETTPAVPKTAEQTPVTPAPVGIPSVDNYLKDVDLDAVMDTKENFVKFMTGFAQTVEFNTTQQTLRTLPNVVEQFTNRKSVMDKLSDEFYETNPDLVPVKQYVASVATQVAAENPELTVPAVFKETAIRTRKALKLKKNVTKRETVASRRSPAFIKNKPGSRKVKAKTTKLQADINDIVDDLY